MRTARSTGPRAGPRAGRRIRGLLLRAVGLLVVGLLAPLAGPAPAAARPLVDRPLPVTPADASANPGWELAAPVGRTWPLRPRPRVVRGFEPPPKPWLSGHRGVDLAGRVGQPVSAVLTGVVTFAGAVAGVGVVVVDHGNLRTTYQPVTATVGRGRLIRAGETIGVLGLAGGHCRPAACLHLGAIVGIDGYRDPLSLFGGARIRLVSLRPAG